MFKSISNYNPKKVLFSFIPVILILNFSTFSGCSIIESPGRSDPPGGYVNLSYEPEIELPDGYSESDLVFEESTLTSPPKINIHNIAVGKIYEIGIVGVENPVFGDDFAVLRYTYNKSDLLKAGLIEDFMVFYYDKSDERWKPVDKIEVDTDNSEVIAYTSHFTSFVLTAIPSASGTVADPPACIQDDYPDGIGGGYGAVFTIIDENFKYYQDRDYFIRHITVSDENAITFAALGFDRALGISTINGTKLYDGDDYIVFTAHTDIDVYVMYDTRGGVDRFDTSEDAPWLYSEGFINTGYFLETTDNVTYYTVYRKSYNQGEEVHLHGNRKGVTDFAINTNYWAIVKRQGDTGSGYASDLCEATSDTTPPALVSNLNAVPGAGVVTLTWQNPDDPDFAGVVIRRSTVAAPMGINDDDEPTGDVISPQSFRDTSVSAGITYYYTVFSLDINNNYDIGESVSVITSVDTDGDSLSDVYENNTVYPGTGLKTDPNLVDSDGDGIGDGDEIAQGTDPTNPDNSKPIITDFTRTSDSPTEDKTVTFNLTGNDNIGITHWMITRTDTKPLADNTNWQAVKPTEYTFGTTGLFKLYIWAKDAAYNVSVPIPPITVDIVNIGAPTGLEAVTLSLSEIRLSWQDNSNIEDTFRIERSSDGVNFTEIGTALIGATIYIDGNLVPATQYWYRVIAFNASDDSEYSNTVKARTLVKTWSRFFGGTMDDEANTTIQTSDGGYLSAGYSTSFGDQNEDMYLVKINENGIEEWSNTFGDYSRDIIYGVQQTDDGGYIAAGEARLSGATTQMGAIVKFDDTGNVQWSYNYENSEQFKSIYQTGDGGFIAAGEGRGDDTDEVYVVKIDDAGIAEWTITFGGPSRQYAVSIMQTNDDGYIVVGDSYNGSNYDIFATKLSESGIEEWSQTYGENDRDFKTGSVVQNSDNGYTIAGTDYFESYNNDIFVIKVDSQGIEQWSNTYGGLKTERAMAIDHSSDGGYIIAGDVNRYGGYGDSRSDFYILKLDSEGVEEWYRILGGKNHDYATSIRQTSDGGYIVGGYSHSYNKSTSYFVSPHDVWVMKLDENGNCNLATPPDLLVETESSTSMELLWNDKYDNENGYRIERSEDGTDFIEIATLLPDTLSFLDTDLIPNTYYYYRIKTYNNIGQSDYSVIQLSKTGQEIAGWTLPSSRDDFISFDTDLFYSADKPTIAMDNNGNAIIVWIQYDGNNSQLYKSEYRNGSWTHPLDLADKISHDGTDVRDVSVAMSDNGDAIITWRLRDSTFTYRLYKSEYRGGSWTHPTDLNDYFIPHDSYIYNAPLAVMDSNGNTLLVWEQRDDNDRSQIFKSEYRNGTWTHPVDLTDNISPDGKNVDYSDVVMNDNGDAIIVWQQLDANDYSQIFKSEYRNGSWTHPASLADNISPDVQASLRYSDIDAKSPRVAMDNSGNAVIIWEQYDNNSFQIFKSEYRNGSWIHPSGLSDNISPDGTSAGGLNVEMDNNGNALISCIQESSVFISEYRNGTWQHPADLSDSINPQESPLSSSPVITMSDNGSAIIIWMQYAYMTGAHIFMSEYRDSEWLHPLTIKDYINPFNYDQSGLSKWPNVVSNSSGNAFIIWKQKNKDDKYQIFISQYMN